MTRRLRLSDDRRAILVRELQAHFHDQHGETIGDLKADLMIDFFLEHLGPRVYNQAIADARQFVQERIDDLEDQVIDFSGGVFEEGER